MLWRGGPFCDYAGLSGGFGQAQGVDEFQLFGGCVGQAAQRALADRCFVSLDAGEQFERGAGAGAVALCLQAHAHDAVEHQGEEADQRMGADALWQAVVDRGDLDVGFEDTEAALDVGQRLVARDGLSRGDVGSPKFDKIGLELAQFLVTARVRSKGWVGLGVNRV